MATQRYPVIPHPIETLLTWVKSGAIAIPEIQHPFVWPAVKVRDLLDSLYHGFPVGYLISWRNPTIKLKDGTRFVIEHAGDPEYSLVTRTSDGQMLFLANKLSKMKQDTKLSSRIAEVHNGSSLFTGQAGQGESNIRRWISGVQVTQITAKNRLS